MCNKIFDDSTERSQTGRYIVKFPLQNEPTLLGDSYKEATRRFHHLEKRFESNPQYSEQYKYFMQEYISLGHMEKIKNQEGTITCYLPHHGVIKESSTTTKLRVVFDASMATSTGYSLNDILMVGPTVQQELFNIMMRFRTHRIAMTADINKMYRQIWVNEEHRHLQQILWRDSKDKPLECYRLKTVTYGTASAPYLATKCLQRLAYDDGQKYPQAATRLLNDFYVDDLITGAETLEEAHDVYNQLTSLLQGGGFHLRKWCSNSKLMLQSVIPEDRETKFPLQFEDKNAIKTLGLLWLPEDDMFKFVVSTKLEEKIKFSKREVLSEIASIFDPLGLLGPVIVKAKLFMQEMWKIKLTWDEPLCFNFTQQWMEFRNQIPSLSKITVQRQVINKSRTTNVQIHGFCDASEKAYGACIYVRSEEEDQVKIHLITSKSRIAPIRKISLPRLELCGAVLLSKLVHKTIESLQLNIQETYLWTDSTIVLNWLKACPSRWKTFVANRVTEIQDLTVNYNWRHVASADNPADFLSRGITPNQLENLYLWWNGPNWLRTSVTQWPDMFNEDIDVENMIEEKSCQNIITCVATYSDELIYRFSSFIRLQRSVAYCMRFTNNAKNPDKKQTGPLTISELHTSLNQLIRVVQSQAFKEEIAALSQNKEIPAASKLKNLNSCLDQEQIIRVGGRLQNYGVTYYQMHPIVLPKHHFTTLLIRYEHARLLHAGAQATLTSLRLKYWPLNGRNTIRSIIHKCIKCFKFNACQNEQQMGNLPADRVQKYRPFFNCGIDYAGPIKLKRIKQRGGIPHKGYIAVFVCLSTRAVHLELVTDLTTQAFLAAFRRFVSRRGKCAKVYSDNATNFKGTRNELQCLYKLFKNEDNKRNIINNAAKEGIDWHFIPPRSPHFGGIWEAAVKSVKYHLKRVIGATVLTFEEMYTLLTQIEACLNSRPLTPISSDPNDFNPLTPSHFLIGEPITAIPEPDLTSMPSNRLTRWQLLQQMLQGFWKRWSQEYLGHLQTRAKWNTPHRNIQVGQLVIIKEENQSPLSWRMGRIIETHPGEDNLTRVVTVNTATGILRRPVVKLCPLPTSA